MFLVLAVGTYVVPSVSGQANRFLTNDGSSMSWAEVATSAGVRSMSVYTGNNTWNKPSGTRSILVTVTGAGGGGSGFHEGGGAGGTSQRHIDVTNINSVSVTVGSLVAVLTTTDVVVMVTLLLLVVTCLLTVVLVVTAHSNTLEDWVVMDQEAH